MNDLLDLFDNVYMDKDYFGIVNACDLRIYHELRSGKYKNHNVYLTRNNNNFMQSWLEITITELDLSDSHNLDLLKTAFGINLIAYCVNDKTTFLQKINAVGKNILIV